MALPAPLSRLRHLLGRTWHDSVAIRWHFITEAAAFLRHQWRWNASVHTRRDALKMQYTLLRLCHTIEKGLSLPRPRRGFGQQKAQTLIAGLEDYLNRHGTVRPEFVLAPIATLEHYVSHTRQSGVPIPDIESALEHLSQHARALLATPGAGTRSTPQDSASGGIIEMTREQIQTAVRGSYADTIRSRHSLRHFDPEPLGDDEILAALELARHTPSACNRQAWHTHVYRGDDSHRLLRWQGGCNGFEDDIHTAIIVTAERRAFLAYETHQAYIDGGLYAMNLINALHSLGLGTIPLSLGFYEQKLRQLRAFGISESETPILIIGCGHLPGHLRIAVSQRRPVSETNTWHR